MHKVTGSLLSLLFLVWFVSGIVMIFDGFPHASRKDRFDYLKPFSEKQMQQLAAPNKAWKGKVTLELCEGEPVYRVYKSRKSQTVYNARTLVQLPTFTEMHARQIATNFLKSPVKELVVQNELDQWIPWSYYQPLLPVYKCYMNDIKHTVLYVSRQTGEIIQQTDRRARWSARVGAIPHWLYFKKLRLQKGLWVNVVIFLSAVGIVACVSGIVVGFIRKKNDKGITPYKKAAYKWHHITGYIFGVFVFTFILSGFFSVAHVPDWMVGVKNEKPVSIKWNQKLDLSAQPVVLPLEIWDALETKENVRRIEWKNLQGQPGFYVYYNHYQVPEVYVLKAGVVQKKAFYTVPEIEALAGAHIPHTDFEVQVQEGYDNYYTGSAMYYLPETAYKIQVNDAPQTWIYLNPISGDEVKRYTKNTRLRRWLYQGLHKFNFQFLKAEADWFRKLLLVVLSLGGIAVSATGVWLSKVWLRRTIRKTKK